MAAAGGRSRFPKSPFTSLMSLTRTRCASRSSQGTPSSGKERGASSRRQKGLARNLHHRRVCGDLGSFGNRKGLRSLPRLFLASRPSGPDTSGGLLREEMLMWSPVPANQGSSARGSLVHETPLSWGRIPENRNLGFPQPWREAFPTHPRPECQVSSRGGGGLRGLPSRAAPDAKSTLPLGGRGRAHTLLHNHTHARSYTHTRAQIHGLRCASQTAALVAAGPAHFPSFPTGGARGAGRGQGRN